MTGIRMREGFQSGNGESDRPVKGGSHETKPHESNAVQCQK